MENNITFEHLLDTLCDEMFKAADSEGCAIALIDENSKKIQGVSGAGIFSPEKVRKNLNNSKTLKARTVLEVMNDNFSDKNTKDSAEIAKRIEYPFGKGVKIDKAESLFESNRIILIKDAYFSNIKIDNVFGFPIRSYSNNQPIGILVLNNTGSTIHMQNDIKYQHLKVLFSTIEYYVNLILYNTNDTLEELNDDYRYDSLKKNSLLLKSLKSRVRLNNVEFPFWIVFSVITFLGGLLYANYLFDIEFFQIGKSMSGKLLIILIGFLIEFILGIIWLERIVKNKMK